MSIPPFQFTPPGEHDQTVPCPYCGHQLDAWTGITGDATPEAGDASICAYCAGLLVFADDLTPREPTETELAALVKDDPLRIAQRAMRQAITDRRFGP